MNKDFCFILNDNLLSRKEALEQNDIKRVMELDRRIHDKLLRLRVRFRSEQTHGYEVVMRSYDDETYWEKRLYPGERWSEEEIEEYVRENWRDISVPWDCSGEMFTYRIEVFNVPAGVLVYYFEAIDI